MADLYHHICGQCGIEFGMPEKFVTTRQEDSQTFYCPNGHPRVFRESTTDKLQRENDRLRQRMAERNDAVAEARAERDSARNQARAFKGVATRIKNRVGAGVCPCCNRTFAELAKHMNTKHPGYRAEEVLPDGATVQ